MGALEFLCGRCAKKQGVEWYSTTVTLRLCSGCHVKQWVNPSGKGSLSTRPTQEEITEADLFHAHKMKVLKQATKNRNAAFDARMRQAQQSLKDAGDPNPAWHFISYEADRLYKLEIQAAYEEAEREVKEQAERERLIPVPTELDTMKKELDEIMEKEPQ